jgi:uncharacterized membrane protein
MKKQTLFLVILTISICAKGFSQVGGIGGSDYEIVFIPGEKQDNSDEFKKIANKMYGTIAYLPSKVEGITETLFLRHNIYRDEMEFSKNGEILYLKKDKDRKIIFTESKEVYRLFEKNNRLKYFLVHNNGKNILLTRKIIKYQDSKPAASSYAKDKAADFKRKSDEVYINFKQGGLLEVPRNKKKFYEIFGDNSNKIKSYVKKNKLNIKKVKQLKKVVMFYNTL